VHGNWGVCVCVDVFNYSCGDQKLPKNSKQTKMYPTGDILLVPTLSNAISMGFSDKVRIRVRN
jgi:hypothetical protein